MLDPEAWAPSPGFRAALEDSGYLRPEAAQALGVAFGSEPRRIDLPLYLRRLDPDSPLHTLIRLFALHVPVAEAEARAALEPLDLGEAGARSRGLAGRAGGSARGLRRDRRPRARARRASGGREGLRGDHVVGLNPPAMLLARLTVRTRVGSALDVGCGGGVQSLLAARHAARVIGVDKNPRAVAFARFNARLNRSRTWNSGREACSSRWQASASTCRLQPALCRVARDQPVVPGRRATGRRFCEEVVRGAAAHLAPNGFATAIVNWVVPDGEPWSRPLERWTSGHGCDAWLLRLETSDTLTYAASWNRQPDAGSTRRHSTAGSRTTTSTASVRSAWERSCCESAPPARRGRAPWTCRRGPAPTRRRRSCRLSRRRIA